MEDVSLTSEQKEFLTECEEEFKDRYTEKDDDFVKIKTQEPKEPPIVDCWYNKPRRPYDRARQDQNKNRNRHDHHWNRHNERNERNERWERHAGKRYMHHRQRMY